MKRAKPKLILLLKLSVSAGLLAYFLANIDLRTFGQTLAAADLSYIALALVVYMAAQLLSTVRWTVLARPLGFKTPFKDFAVYYLIGMFFNLFAPGTVGGDVSRIYYLAREGEDGERSGWTANTLRSVISVFMDRAVGMVALIWLGAIGLALFPQFGVPSAVRSLIFALALAFVVAAFLLPLIAKLLPRNEDGAVGKWRLILRTYRGQFRVIPLAVALSFGAHLIQAWMHLLMGWALHLDIPLAYCIILYPLVGAFAALPVSLNGLGLREGGYIFLLNIIGFGSEQGVAFGLLLFLIVAFDSLVGGIIFLLKKDSRPAAMSSEIKIRSGSV